MASRRYSRILESARYYGAISNYIRYVQGTAERQTRIGQGTARPESQRLYILPFDVDLADGQKVPCSAAKPSWTTYASHFTGYTDAIAPTSAENIVRVAEYAPARVVITTGRAARATQRTSQVTRLPYGSYGGTSTSIPFGKKLAADTMVGAFTAIRTAIITAAGATPPRISLTKEKVSL